MFVIMRGFFNCWLSLVVSLVLINWESGLILILSVFLFLIRMLLMLVLRLWSFFSRCRIDVVVGDLVRDLGVLFFLIFVFVLVDVLNVMVLVGGGLGMCWNLMGCIVD